MTTEKASQLAVVGAYSGSCWDEEEIDLVLPPADVEKQKNLFPHQTTVWMYSLHTVIPL